MVQAIQHSVFITTLEPTQHVSLQIAEHHRRHRLHHPHLLVVAHFYTHTQSIEALAVAKQSLQLLHAVKLLFVVVELLLLHLLLLHHRHQHLVLVIM